MIVPMKKVSLVMLAGEKKKALKTLRRLGLLHMEITEKSGETLVALHEQIAKLEMAISTVAEKHDRKTPPRDVSVEESLAIATTIVDLVAEKEACRAERLAMQAELDRLQDWGDLDPADLALLRDRGLHIALYDMPPTEYGKAEIPVKTLVLDRTKRSVRFITIQTDEEAARSLTDGLLSYQVRPPQEASEELRRKLDQAGARIQAIEAEWSTYAVYVDGMKQAAASLRKDVEFETYATGMDEEILSGISRGEIRLSYFTGYIPAEDLDQLRQVAKDHAWGLLAEDPTPDDDVPTKLKNNRFVSLIYPLTDFLGTVPGYFEYDISGWFLGFILVFFGIIFGDGGYGLVISAIAGALILRAYLAKKPIPAAFWLILLMGGATVLWGVLTCTWFGLAPEQLPAWLQSLSLPPISNVYADQIWYPFWTNGAAGLTTSQNLQILCFSLALIQLCVAHVKGMIRHRKSLKLLGDLGSVLQLLGMFYVVLALVVNGQVFGLGLVISGIPVGITAIALIGVGFVMSFIFANYEGSVARSVLASLKGIVSVLLGVVNVFSDIVSYIRLWAVGLAGAAISATVNELAGPFLGNFMFMIVAIVLLVFGHGLNMILNVLSVIVHGVRLNTLEFSTHLDMSWSGHKYKPFQE